MDTEIYPDQESCWYICVGEEIIPISDSEALLMIEKQDAEERGEMIH